MKYIQSTVTILILCLFILPHCTKEFSCEDCTDGNLPPFAIAGSDSLINLPTDSTLLNGANSFDQDGQIVNWSWRMIKGPKSALITSPTKEMTFAKFPDTGFFVFELKVTDDKGWSARDSIRITVVDPRIPNQPPIANAGMDHVITLPDNSVSLDGTASTDPENKLVSFTWAKIAGPDVFTLTNANGDKAQVLGLEKGIYLFELTVTDHGGLSSKDTVQVEVKDLSMNCNNDSRPIINAQLIPIGKLSKARIAMNTASVGNKILFAGGRLSADYPDYWGSTRVDIYDTETKQWTTSELSAGRYGMASVTVGNKVFFAGGENENAGSSLISDRVDVYDATSNTWTKLTLSEPRTFIAAAAIGSKIFFAGGWNGSAQFGEPSSKIDIYDLNTNQWAATKSLSEPRGWISGVTANQHVYFAGGLKSYPLERTGVIDVYNTISETWSVSNLLFPMSHMAGVFAGGTIFWAYGCDVQSKDLGTGNFRRSKLNKSGYWINGLGQNAVVKDNKIVFFGQNGDTFGVHSNGFDIYDLATGTWSIGLLPNFNLAFTSIIALNNKIYLTGGVEIGTINKTNDQVWLLEF